jgi:hypothetical protein
MHLSPVQRAAVTPAECCLAQAVSRTTSRLAPAQRTHLLCDHEVTRTALNGAVAARFGPESGRRCENPIPPYPLPKRSELTSTRHTCLFCPIGDNPCASLRREPHTSVRRFCRRSDDEWTTARVPRLSSHPATAHIVANPAAFTGNSSQRSCPNVRNSSRPNKAAIQPVGEYFQRMTPADINGA